MFCVCFVVLLSNKSQYLSYTVSTDRTYNRDTEQNHHIQRLFCKNEHIRENKKYNYTNPLTEELCVCVWSVLLYGYKM